MSYNDWNEVADELFESFLSRYPGSLEASMEGNEFIFDSVQLMYYKCHRAYFSLSGSYIDFPDWIKKKKAKTINMR